VACAFAGARSRMDRAALSIELGCSLDPVTIIT
jgi:hypothetical protein